MSLNWQNLRSLNSSQSTAFEELCCQLAAYEPVPVGAQFVRKGAPDAGVECFWRLANGDEWGWQAKFFSTIGDSQWSQLDDSVKTALEKHPRLIMYIVCLPVDRQDPRIQNQRWSMDKWNERAQRWQNWASEKDMSVSFDYWGEHEIFERLSREEHRGRYYFWFREEFFSRQWFKHCVEETIANAGPRYTPELNVDLSIARLFDGLGRTANFYDRVKELHGHIRTAYSRIRRIEDADQELAANFITIERKVHQLLSRLCSLEEGGMEWIGWELIDKLASEASVSVRNNINILYRRLDKGARESTAYQDDQRIHSALYELRELGSRLNDTQAFATSSEACLSNKPDLLLVGSAGTGKTHLFCDIAHQRGKAGLPTVMLMGEQFRQGEPWVQINEILNLNCTRDEFLGALEAAAQTQKTRALILIDALNESQDRSMWKSHLAGMLRTLSRYPWVGVALSVRTAYEELVVPEDLVSTQLLKEEHHGFTGYEHQATRTFFDYFHIERPGVLLLVPEFQNPLFLKIFCKGLFNDGLTKVPPGLQGITKIFNFFVASVNKKLARPEYLDFHEGERIVWKAINELAKVMAEKGRRWLNLDESQDTLDRIKSSAGHEKSLYRHLLSEGIIAEDRFGVGDEQQEGIEFAYERFSDHLIAKYLLDTYFDADNPLRTFAPGQPLARFVEDMGACIRNAGILEAFAIQLPERTGRELVDI